MKELYKDSDGVPQFINAMEAAQRKSKRAKLVINDEFCSFLLTLRRFHRVYKLRESVRVLVELLHELWNIPCVDCV